jgi:uncharacterized protein YndB with AHSA1/START domain
MTTSPTGHRAPAGPDYQKTITVAAPPAAAFDALTTTAGLAAWWVPVTGNGQAGGELRFQMNFPQPLVIQVEQATRPAEVRWAVTACDFVPDWVGTRPAFTITPDGDGGCAISFRHHGLTPDLECIDMCTAGWNHYLGSLREYLETGSGSPLGSPGDQARRAG